MKKYILSIAFLVAGITATIAQNPSQMPPPPGGPAAKCDSLSVDSVSVLAPGHLQIFLHNRSSVTAANPTLKGELDPNAYMALDTVPATTAVFNDSATNGGTTVFSIGIKSITSADSIPVNTVFTGTVILAEPTDTIIYCNVTFSFTYGNLFPLSVAEVAAAPVYVTVNGDQLSINGDLQNANLQIQNIAGQVLFTENKISAVNKRTLSIANLPAGMYFLSIQRGNDRLVKKFMKE